MPEVSLGHGVLFMKRYTKSGVGTLLAVVAHGCDFGAQDPQFSKLIVMQTSCAHVKNNFYIQSRAFFSE